MENSNFMVEKPGRQHLNQVIKVNVTSKGMYGYHVRIFRDKDIHIMYGYSEGRHRGVTSTCDSLAKNAHLNLILSKRKTNES